MGPITKDVRNLCRDRINCLIDNSEFSQRILGALSRGNPKAIGLALAKWDSNYLYLLTDMVSPEIASWVRHKESDWAIVMKWGRCELRGDREIKRMLDSLLQSSINKDTFEQELKDWIHKNARETESQKYLREELVGAILDFSFGLADEVNPVIRQEFNKHVNTVSK